MRAEEVLDYQADFIARVGTSEYRDVLDTILRDQMKDQGITARAGGIMSIVKMHAELGSAFHLAGPMTAVVTNRARGFADTRLASEFTPPTELGFMILDEPFHSIELTGLTQKTHAITWGPAASNRGPGICITLWNDTVRGPDDVYDATEQDAVSKGPAAIAELHRIRRLMGRWEPITVHIVTRNVPTPIGPWLLSPNEEQTMRTLAGGKTPHVGESGIRFVFALWEMMSETVHVDADISRSFRRRAEKAKLPPRVTIIALRRTDHTESVGETHIEWQHRWPVRGHMRRIRDRQTGEIKYTVYVHPHVKGPADKPIIDTRKVYDLKR